MSAIIYTAQNDDYESLLRISHDGYPEFNNGFSEAIRTFEEEGNTERAIIAKLAKNFLEVQRERDEALAELEK
jgi:hypothetical protein